MERVFRSHGMSVSATMEISSDETIKQAAMAGMRLAFLSLNTVELERWTMHLVVFDVIGMPVMRDWHIVHRKDKRLPPVASAFREFLLSQTDKASARAPVQRRGRGRRSRGPQPSTQRAAAAAPAAGDETPERPAGAGAAATR